jgi:uncharacterized membrane protein YecN with MAPEG domain
MRSASSVRRWLAGVFLGVALLMLAVGLTVLSSRLRAVGFLVYWLICFGLTGAAALVALIDLFLLRRQLRHAQQELIEQTLNEAKNDLKRNAG